MKIQVTQDDIVNGEPNTLDNCAVARAVARERGGCWRVSKWVLRRMETDEAHATPPHVREFIIAYDSGKPVQPMEFELA